MTSSPFRAEPPASLVRAIWCAVALLVAIGVVAAIGRASFPGDLATRFDPLRERLFDALRLRDPFASQRAAEVQRVDSRFGGHLLLTLLHVIPGGLFLLVAPLQFSARIRNRHIQIHRWSGRVLMTVGIVTVLASLYFGVLVPYGGPLEAVLIGLMACGFVFSVVRAFVAIRRHQVARHREWMIRAVATALAISTVRLVIIPLDLVLTPAGVRPPDIFVISIWTGWAITLGAAELWIRYSRPRTQSLLADAARAVAAQPGSILRP